LNTNTLTILVGEGGLGNDYYMVGGGWPGGGNGSRASGCDSTGSGGAGGGGSFVCEGTSCNQSSVLLAAGGGGGGIGLTDWGGGGGGGGNELGTGPQSTCYQVCTINLLITSSTSSCSYDWYSGYSCSTYPVYTVDNTGEIGDIQVYSYWEKNDWWNGLWNETGGWWLPSYPQFVPVNNSVYQSLVNICGYYGWGIFQGDEWLPTTTSTLPSISDACAQSCSQVCGIWSSSSNNFYIGFSSTTVYYEPPTYHFMQGQNAEAECPGGDGGGGGGYYGGPAGIGVWAGGGFPGWGGSGYCSPIVQNCGGITGGANNGDRQTNATIRGGNGIVIISW
jgi:hypothetical protein